jgi:hypothetical protein
MYNFSLLRVILWNWEDLFVNFRDPLVLNPHLFCWLFPTKSPRLSLSLSINLGDRDGQLHEGGGRRLRSSTYAHRVMAGNLDHKGMCEEEKRSQGRREEEVCALDLSRRRRLATTDTISSLLRMGGSSPSKTLVSMLRWRCGEEVAAVGRGWRARRVAPPPHLGARATSSAEASPQATSSTDASLRPLPQCRRLVEPCWLWWEAEEGRQWWPEVGYISSHVWRGSTAWRQFLETIRRDGVVPSPRRWGCEAGARWRRWGGEGVAAGR